MCLCLRLIAGEVDHIRAYERTVSELLDWVISETKKFVLLKKSP